MELNLFCFQTALICCLNRIGPAFSGKKTSRWQIRDSPGAGGGGQEWFDQGASRGGPWGAEAGSAAIGLATGWEKAHVGEGAEAGRAGGGAGAFSRKEEGLHPDGGVG